MRQDATTCIERIGSPESTPSSASFAAFRNHASGMCRWSQNLPMIAHGVPCPKSVWSMVPDLQLLVRAAASLKTLNGWSGVSMISLQKFMSVEA